MDKHIKEQLSNHVVDFVKTVKSEMEAHRNESLCQEPASQEGSNLNELSARTQHQRNEIDEMRRLSSTVCHLERQLEELRARQERPLQELNIR